MTVAETFRQLHVPGEPVVMPNPWDIGSARLLHTLGFEALATTSSGHAHSIGRADGIRAVSREEAIDHALQLVEATPLPVNGDLERGYGDTPEDCATTIRMAIEAGLAGASIEDTTGIDDDPVYAFDLAVERVEAAVEAAAAAPNGFVFTARADGLLAGRGSMDEIIERLQAYEAAGADVVYAPGLPDLDAVRSVTAAVSVPVNVLASVGWTTTEMAEAGAARISIGSGLSRVAYGAMVAAAETLRDKGSVAWAADAIPFDRLQELFTD